MNQLEIVFENVDKNSLEKLILNELKINKRVIISSHFFNKEKETDIEFKDLLSLGDYFKNPGTGNIYAKYVDIGIKVSNVMIVISYDESYGDIVLNFNDMEIMRDMGMGQTENYRYIIKRIYEIFNNIVSDRVIIGYEPATDEDMQILSIDKTGIHISDDLASNFALVLKGMNL